MYVYTHVCKMHKNHFVLCVYVYIQMCIYDRQCAQVCVCIYLGINASISRHHRYELAH